MTLDEKFESMHYAYRRYKTVTEDREMLVSELLRVITNITSPHDHIISKDEVDRIGKMITREIVFLYDKKIDESRKDFELAMSGEKYPEVPDDIFRRHI